MFESFPPFMKALLALVLIILAANALEVLYDRHMTKLVTYYAPARITDLAGRETRTFHAGQPIILHLFVNRTSLDCYADYYQTLDGPVTVQFNHTRSLALYSNHVHREISLLFELPKVLPHGTYTWRNQGFPICGSERLDPVIFNIGNITIQ